MPAAANLYNENIADYFAGATKAQKKDQKAVAVQVTPYVGRYIKDYIGADQLIYRDPAGHKPLPEKWVGVECVDREHRRLRQEVTPKCRILNKDGQVVVKYTKEDGDTFTVRNGDVVRCKGRVFGQVKRIDARVGAGVRPNPSLHLHFWRHERDGMLQNHAHPKRLFQLESCGDINFNQVVEKLDIVDGHVRPGFHPQLRAENSYICSHRLIAATNSLVGIPSDSLGCPGCVIKDKKPKRFAVNDFVVFRRAGADSKDPCEIGIVKRASSPLVVLPLSRWDDFIKQEGVKESAIFRGDEKLFYVKNTSAVHVDEIEEAIDKKINFIGLSRVQGLGAALRPLQPTSSLSDFWIGKRFVDESEDIFCLMDGDAANLDYLYQNEEKRRQFSGRSDLLNNMRQDAPLVDQSALIQTCVEREERARYIGSQTGIIDCCAGIGGFSMGVVDTTRASIPLAVENEVDIAEQYGRLHPATVVVDKGVAFAAKNWGALKIRAQLERFKYVIVQAGVPCQPFSRLNRHKKAEDPRIGIIFEVLSLLQISGASHLLVECVDGMLYHCNGTENGEKAEIICIALRILIDLGYQYTINVHQAAAHGTPQSRQRLFIWASKLGLPLPSPPDATHYAGSSGMLKLRRYDLQPVPAHGPLYYVTQHDAISDLPDIIEASTSAFSGDFRSQFFGYHHGVKSYKTRPLNNYQSMMREYKDEPRVGLQYCHIPTQSTYAKILAENDKDDKRHRLPGTFPCVTTGSLVAHPTQQRLFTPRERLRAQGVSDLVQLRWKPLSDEELIKEYDLLCVLAGNAVPTPLARAQGRAFIKSLA